MRTLLTILALTTLTACPFSVAPNAWWQDFKDNPAIATETVISGVETIEGVAILAFNQIKPHLPQDKQAEFQAKFDQTILTLAQAVVAARSAVQAAADIKEAKPDLSKVISDMTKAVTDIQAVVAEARKILTSKLALNPVSTPINTSTSDVLDEMVLDFQR